VAQSWRVSNSGGSPLHKAFRDVPGFSIDNKKRSPVGLRRYDNPDLRHSEDCRVASYFAFRPGRCTIAEPEPAALLEPFDVLELVTCLPALEPAPFDLTSFLAIGLSPFSVDFSRLNIHHVPPQLNYAAPGSSSVFRRMSSSIFDAWATGPGSRGHSSLGVQTRPAKRPRIGGAQSWHSSDSRAQAGGPELALFQLWGMCPAQWMVFDLRLM